jgi:hypothetical protein
VHWLARWRSLKSTRPPFAVDFNAADDASAFVAFGVAVVSDQTGAAATRVTNTETMLVHAYTEGRATPMLESFFGNG